MLKLLIALAVLISLSQNAFAEECNTVLKETDSYQDLSIILNCLARKIDSLEKEVKKAKSENTSTAEDGKATALLENKYITVYGLRVSRKENSLLVSFIIKSKYDSDLHMSLLRDSGIIIDDMGDSTNRYNVYGFSFNSQDNKNERDYTTLNPAVPTPVSIKFEADKIKGNELSFKISLLNLIGEKPAIYSFGKTKIKLDQ
jgi:hypothetical protein